MPQDMETARELATHATEIRHLQEDVTEIRHDVTQIKDSVEEVRRILAEARGGWRTLMAIGGGAAALGAGLTHWIDKVLK